MKIKEKTFMIVGHVESAKDLLYLAKDIKTIGIKNFETYSPFPIHGMDPAMGLKDSPLSWLALIGGLTGVTGGFALQIWTSAFDYKIYVSGKPLMSLPAFIPVAFELTILFTAFAVVFGMLALNKLPQWHHPIFEHSQFEKVTNDGFFISISTTDPHYNEETIQTLLKKYNTKDIEKLEE